MYFNVRGGAGDITKANTSARLQDNLYLAVNSEWLEKAKIPSDRSRTSSFDGIDLNIEKNLMQDFADFAAGKKELPTVPNFKKAVELYKVAKNFDKRNADGAAPIQADLHEILDLRNFADFNLKAADFYKNGFAVPFAFSVEADMKNTKIHSLNFGGPSTFLPDTTTYKTPAAEKLLDVLKKQSIKLLTMAGLDEKDAEDYADLAIKYDAKIARLLSQLKNGQITQQLIIQFH